ncbi:MAG: hypothetical protein AMXMBFR59_37690 [Rhodanobacteraceae bacterium]
MRESLASVAMRAQRIVVAEIVAVDSFDEGANHNLDVEAIPEQVIVGPVLEPAEFDTLLCRYAEARARRSGDAMLSPLVSGSGEEFRARRGDRVILLLAAAPAPVVRDSPSRSGDDEAVRGETDLGAETEPAPRDPDCTLLRIESLQNRITILRYLRHAAEARDHRP